MSTISKRTFEFVEGTSKKFWEAWVEDVRLTTRWGRLGTEAQSKTKSYATSAKADSELTKLIDEKLQKGYRETTGEAGKTAITRNPSADAVILIDQLAKELATLQKQWRAANQCEPFRGKKIEEAPTGKSLLKENSAVQVAAVSLALDHLERLVLENKAYSAKLKPGVLTQKQVSDWEKITDPIWVYTETLRAILRKKLPLDESTVTRLLQWPARDRFSLSNHWYPLAGFVNVVENFAVTHELGELQRNLIEKIIKKLLESPYKDHCRKPADRLQAVLIEGQSVNLDPGEAWSDLALSELKKLTSGKSQAWKDLLNHCQAGGRGKISAVWQKEALPLVDAVSFTALKDCVLRWFPLIDLPRTQRYVPKHNLEPDYTDVIIPKHVELLRGLVWACGLRENADLARAIAKLAISAYRKIPGKGPRLVSLGNACITSLGMMPGLPPIGQLAILKVKVKFGTAQKEIEKAFNAAAAREKLPREEIEEMAVPSYGLEEVGVGRSSLGDYRAELLVDGSSAALHWSKDGKPIKSVPASVKKEHGEEFKELQTSLKDINTMLPAQRERLDALLLSQKTWPIDIWRERYLDHPLVGTIARRLIWSFTTKGKALDGIWHNGQIVGLDGKQLALRDDTTVALWHPIGREVSAVLAWRNWLERQEVIQPFKQAHREVYVLTDAERNTGTYSNRFAAHVLKQHQFNSLCAARGWKNRLRLMVDDSYPQGNRTKRR